MEETIDYKGLSRSKKYELLLAQIKALMDENVDWVANAANLCAAVITAFNWHWVGFYRVLDDQKMILGPFQGPVACSVIQKGKGVCGTVWEKEKTLIVPNVDLFEGHIACSALSKSEMVLPVFKDGNVWGVLDIDSRHLDDFSELDKNNLERITEHFGKYL